MSWLRIDDGFTEHRKIVELKRAERWTWLELLAYCARQGNGTIPPGITDVLKHVNKSFISRCKSLGLIDFDGITMSVHDWETYNPKDPTKAERQARWRAKQAEGVDGGVDAPVDGDVDGGVDENDRLQNRLRDGAPSPTPPPPLTGSSTVSDYPHLPVVPDPVGGAFEPEHPENEPPYEVVASGDIVYPLLEEFPQ